MAKLWEKKETIIDNIENNVDTNELPNKEINSIEDQNATMQSVLKELQSIRSNYDKVLEENTSLKYSLEKVILWQPISLQKKTYDWPKTYRMKLWWWIPVLSYKTWKKKENKELVFEEKHVDWTIEYVSNQILILTLASKDKNGNNVEEKADVIDFWKNFKYSDGYEAEVVSDWKTVKWYYINTEDFWKIFINSNCIN